MIPSPSPRPSPRRPAFARWALIPLAGLALPGAEECGAPPPDCPACVADFALYDPAYEDDGVWEEEVVALTTMFTALGFTWQVVDHRDLNGGILGIGEDRAFRALIAPGGYAERRDLTLTAAGEQGIRDFIAAGGAWVGFCAGTFWAADTVVWAEEASGGGGAFNAEADYAAYPYDLGLLAGEALGPFGWAPWEAGTGVSFQLARIDTRVEAMAIIGIPPETRFFYYGGPVYRFDAPPEGLEVWARAAAPPGIPPDARTGDGDPTIVRYRYGEGQVILFSYHPEILIGSLEDGVELADPVDEGEVAWETGAQSLEEINRYSQAIVRAALQLAAGRPVTP